MLLTSFRATQKQISSVKRLYPAPSNMSLQLLACGLSSSINQSHGHTATDSSVLARGMPGRCGRGNWALGAPGTDMFPCPDARALGRGRSESNRNISFGIHLSLQPTSLSLSSRALTHGILPSVSLRRSELALLKPRAAILPKTLLLPHTILNSTILGSLQLRLPPTFTSTTGPPLLTGGGFAQDEQLS